MGPKLAHVTCRSCRSLWIGRKAGLFQPCPECGSEDLNVEWRFNHVPWVVLLVIATYFLIAWLTS